MTTTIQLLSMLLSLAMMLTGSHGLEAPEPAFRTLTISNVTLAVNDETITLNPSLTMGVGTEAGKALYDFAVNLNGEKLFPAQLLVTEDGLTAHLVNADTAVTLPASALASLSDSALDMSGAQLDADSQALVDYSKQLIPAYTRVFEKLSDPAFAQEMSARADAILQEVVDRGEGTAETLAIEGETYDVTTWHYALDSAQLAELIDRIYASDEDMNALYEAIFGLYSVLPEESGLRDIHSYADLFEKTGLQMTAEVTESATEDGEIQVADVTFTLDLAAMIAATADEGAEMSADIPPMVMNVHSRKIGETVHADVDCQYAVEGVSMDLNSNVVRDAAGQSADIILSMDAGDQGGFEYDIHFAKSDTSRSANVDFSFANDDNTMDMLLSYEAGAVADSADWEYALTFDLDIAQGDAEPQGVGLTCQGVKRGDASESATIALGVAADSMNLGLTFDADIAVTPIEDVTTGRDSIVIEDLQNAGDAIDADVIGKLQGSLMEDAGKLMQDDSVSALLGLGAMTRQGADEAVVDDKEDIEGDGEVDMDPDSEIEYGDSIEGDAIDAGDYNAEPEDDGELPYDEPALGYLPDGINIVEYDVDTAYDAVNIVAMNDDGTQLVMAYFSVDNQDNPTVYVMNDEGKLVESDVNDLQVSRDSEGNWTASIIRDGVAANLYITMEGADPDTVAQIINGLTF